MSRDPRAGRGEVIRRPETKSFILTSEFWVAAGAVAAVFLGGYVLDDIANTTAWKYGTWIAIAYIVSRGIAKAGSQRSYQPEPYDNRGQVDFWGYPDRRSDQGNRGERRDTTVDEFRRDAGRGPVEDAAGRPASEPT
jgi:hypothetical protein